MDGVTKGLMNRAQRRAARTHMARESRTYPAHLIEISFAEHGNPPPGLVTVWRSRDYLVQVFEAPPPALARLSVNRAQLVGNGWGQDIPWEDLQRIKSQCGFATHDAVEVYPHDMDVVNVANMRHIWVLEQPLPFAWRKR